jgi:hypothetical protein
LPQGQNRGGVLDHVRIKGGLIEEPYTRTIR